MKGHTPEPWGLLAHFPDYIVPSTHRGRRNGGAADDIVDRDDYAQIIARVREDRHGRGDIKANAARIVACVNACTGINPEAVPDLLEALKAVDSHPHTTFPPDAAGEGPLDKVRAAIAKATSDG